MNNIISRNFIVIRESCERARQISELIHESFQVNLKCASAKNDWEKYGEIYKLLNDFNEHRSGFEISNSCAIFILND